MAEVIEIVNESKRSGEKNGKAWNIMTVKVDNDGDVITADSFDRLEVGSAVTVTFDDKYNSYNAKRLSAKEAATDDKLSRIERKLDAILEHLDLKSNIPF